MWQWGVLLAGGGFCALCLVASFLLLRSSKSLQKVDANLALMLEESKRALPAVSHSLEQVDEMVTSINEKFTAADRAMNATGAALNGWRERVRQRFVTVASWTRHAGRAPEEGRTQ